jgi:hypothetical protein
MSDEKQADELPTRFKDERHRDWEVKLSVPVVYRFCAAHHVRLGELHPSLLSQSQLIDLAYAGTRWQARAEAKPEQPVEFQEALEGASYTEAMLAASRAVVNFILRTEKRTPSENAGANAENLGTGGTSGDSAPSPA